MNSVSASCGVSTEVGSSMISSFGFCSRQRTISMRWRSPTERSCTVRSGLSGRPYSREVSMMRSRRLARSLGSLTPSATFSATVSDSNSEKCWNTMPMPSRRACAGLSTVTFSPRQTISPASGRVTP